MVIVIVTFPLNGAATTVGEMAARFLKSAPRYREQPGLLVKHYIVSADTRTAGGVYSWESRAQAEQLFTPAFSAFIRTTYGCEPEIRWFESPVTVDNLAGSIHSDAASTDA